MSSKATKTRKRQEKEIKGFEEELKELKEKKEDAQRECTHAKGRAEGAEELTKNLFGREK